MLYLERSNIEYVYEFFWQRKNIAGWKHIKHLLKCQNDGLNEK